MGATKKIQLLIVTTRDGLFEAFIFVSLGMCFAFFEIKMSARKSLFFFILSMMLMGAEIFALQSKGFIRQHDMYFFLVPTTFFFFCYIKDLELPDSPIYKTLRSLSSLIFYSHLWINGVVSKALRIIYEPLCNSWLHFMITLIVTIVFSYAIIKLSNYHRFKWLNILYV